MFPVDAFFMPLWFAYVFFCGLDIDCGNVDQGWTFKLDYEQNHGDRVISNTLFTMVKLVNKEVYMIFMVVYVCIQCY